MTKLNQKILEMLNESSGHLTAEEAFLLAKEKKIDVSMASIYRILGKLADDGLIKRIIVPGHSDIFDKTVKRHEHLICIKCGRVNDAAVPDLLPLLKKETGIDSICSYNLSIAYICESCRQDVKEY